MSPHVREFVSATCWNWKHWYANNLGMDVEQAKRVYVISGLKKKISACKGFYMTFTATPIRVPPGSFCPFIKKV